MTQQIEFRVNIRAFFGTFCTCGSSIKADMRADFAGVGFCLHYYL